MNHMTIHVKPRYIFAASMFFYTLATVAREPVITPYQESRDITAIKKIFADHYHELTYEALGYEQGTTEKYFASKTYVTDVIRLHDQTIGFINYAAYNRNFCTFHWDRRGFIHLIGIDKKYQGKGYGTLLLEHAMQQLITLQCSYIDVSVQGTNSKAINLYKKKGFVCHISPELQTKLPTLFMSYNTGVPFDRTRCNIIQQYPKTCAAIAILAFLAYGYQRYV
jgi:ribosomal protein S18 acetylase RimI-like enzyme